MVLKLLFYIDTETEAAELLNEDDFLEENSFSRQEIKDGLKDVISKHGLGGLTDAFLMDF